MLAAKSHNGGIVPGSDIRGVLPVFHTPFNDDETIDYPTLEREIDWLFQAQVDGIVMALVSETLRLSTDERRQVADFVTKCADGKGVSIISIGAESAYVAEEFARHAESIGADAVMAIPPVATSALADETVAYYRRIIEAVSIPVVVQDASGYLGNAMPVPVQAGLMLEYGADRVMFKPEAVPLGPNLTALNEATNGEATILEGSGGSALVDSYRRGVSGTMPGADLIHGLVALWNALQAGDDERVYALSMPITAICSGMASLDAYLAVEKHLLVRQGVFRNTVVRGPVAYHLDDATRENAEMLFDRMMAVVEEST
jgi:dihydrodipicolinate synthase/N-acetylneuraminate lyase